MFEFTAADWHCNWHRRAMSQESVNWPDCSSATQISYSKLSSTWGIILNVSRFRNCSAESSSPLFMAKSLQLPAFSFPLWMQDELSTVSVSAYQLIFSCIPLLEHVTAVIFPQMAFLLLCSHIWICILIIC